jgi:hypothetical protein
VTYEGVGGKTGEAKEERNKVRKRGGRKGTKKGER